MKKINGILSVFFIVLITFFTSCKKDPDVNPNINNVSGDPGHTVNGVVRDQNGNSLSGITVQCNGQKVSTGNFGEFTFKNVTVSNNRIVVYSNPSNYFAATATEIPSSTKKTMVNLTLMTKTTTQVLSSSSGGSATHTSGSSVTIPADAIQKNGSSYSGNVNVAVAYLDPTESSFGSLTQGADMKAVNTSGNEGTLTSYGIIRVELTDDNGNELNLVSGKTATIKVPVPSSLQGTAPATIPLWYFDETKGIWIEEGSAVKAGNEYVGTVSHFTDWNCDVYSPSGATITGRVVDCNNDPISNIAVQTGQTFAYTDVNGIFSRRVPSGIDFTCQIETTINNGLTSDPISITALTAGQQYDVGDVKLTVCPTYVAGTIVDCNNNPTEAWVQLKTSDGYSQLINTSNGSYKGRVATNIDVTLSVITSNGGIASGSMTTSSTQGIINDFGTTKVCGGVSIGENSFTLDGNGFSNEKFTTIINTPLPDYYVQNDDYSYAYVMNNSTYGDSITTSTAGNCTNTDFNRMIINVSYYGQTSATTGTFNITDGYHVYIQLVNTSSSTSKTFYAKSGTITMNKIESQGGLIEGTFSGTFVDLDTNANLNVTDGNFSALVIN